MIEWQFNCDISMQGNKKIGKIHTEDCRITVKHMYFSSELEQKKL